MYQSWASLHMIFDYQLAMAQNEYISRHRHMLLYTKVAHGYKQDFGL